MKYLNNGFWVEKKQSNYVFNNSEVHSVIEQKIQSENLEKDAELEKKLKNNIDEVLAVVPYKAVELKNILINNLPKSSQENWNTYMKDFQNLIENKFIKNLSESEQATLKVSDSEIKTTGATTLDYQQKLAAVGLGGADEKLVQQAMIDAGYLEAEEVAIANENFNLKTIEALDKYQLDQKKAVKKQEKFNENIVKIENATVENFSVSGLNFDLQNEMYDPSGNLKENASVLDLQNGSRSFEEDSIIFQKELGFFDKEFLDLQNVSPENSTKKEGSVGDKFWNFGKSFLAAGGPFFPIVAPVGALLDATDLLPGKKQKERALQNKKEALVSLFKEKKEALNNKKNKLSENKNLLQQSGDSLKNREIIRKNNYKNKVSTQNETLENSTVKNQSQIDDLQNKQNLLRQLSDGLNEKQSNLNKQLESTQNATDTNVARQNKITKTIEALENIVSDLPPFSPQTKKIQTVLQTLKSTQANIGGQKLSYQYAYDTLLQQQDDIANYESNTNDAKYEIGLANASLGSAMNSLEVLKLQNGTRSEQVLANFDQNIENISILDSQIDLQAEKTAFSNEQTFVNFEEIESSVASFEPKLPSYWEQSVGGMMTGFGQGLSWATETVLTYPTKQLSKMGQWLEKSDNQILSFVGSNMDFVGDIGTGVIEGASEIVKGITTMIGSPIEAAKGMGALIGRDPQTGDFSFGTFGSTWKMFGQAMIGMDEDGNWGDEGDRGLALGKAIANIGSLFIPGSGAVQSARLAAMGATRVPILGRVGAICVKAPLAFGKAVAKNAYKKGGSAVRGIASTPKRFGRAINPIRRFKRRGLKNTPEYYHGPDGVITKVKNQINANTNKYEHATAGYRVKTKFKNAEYVFKNADDLNELITKTAKGEPKIDFAKIKVNAKNGKRLTSAEQKVLMEEFMKRRKTYKLEKKIAKYDKGFLKKARKNPEKFAKYFEDKQKALNLLDDTATSNLKELISLNGKVLKESDIYTPTGRLGTKGKEIIKNQAVKEKIISNKAGFNNKLDTFNDLKKNYPNDLRRLTKDLETNFVKYKKQLQNEKLFTKYQTKIDDIKGKPSASSKTPKAKIIKPKFKQIERKLYAGKAKEALVDFKEIDVKTLKGDDLLQYDQLKKSIKADLGVIDPILSKIPTKAVRKKWWTATKGFTTDVFKAPKQAWSKIGKGFKHVWKYIDEADKIALIKKASIGLPIKTANKIIGLIGKNKVIDRWTKVEAIIAAHLSEKEQGILYKNMETEIDTAYLKYDDEDIA